MSSYNNDDYFDDVDRALKKKYLDDEDIEIIEDYFDVEPEIERTVTRKKKLNPKQRRQLEAKRKERIKKQKRKRRLKIVFSVLLVLVLTVCFLLFTKPGQSIILKFASLYVKNTMQEDDSVKFEPPETVPEGWIYDENVINILLVGIEENGGAANTDSMILVSQNLETGQITMVSLLRDTYVDIAGLNVKRKLNYAYSHGNGIQTLIDTVQNTYHIFINAYVSLDYESFEDVIDMLGGVNIEITQQEADYLNTTNYISDPANRNLTSGVVKMNGNQALGYCRVRMVPTPEGVNDDYGRTLRQRKVISALFEAYKDQGLTDLISVTNSILGSVTTSLSSDNIYAMLKAYIDHKTDGLNQLQLPANGMFTPTSVSGVGSVLSIEGYEQENIDLLHQTLYGRTAVTTEG
ncbi:MAG: LCP family protein [Lachnospiraceae bacterium]|nr:LCP family protein [Lachnospiraceae bacterium]